MGRLKSNITSNTGLMAGAFPESRVVKIWQDCLPGRTGLVTEEDGPVEIVYPGRLNDDRGADIRDAVIVTSQGLKKGDIEIHLKSSSWWGHRHHQDPLYNRVILHVVYWRDVPAAVILQNGQKVPTLALQRYVENQVGRTFEPFFPVGLRPMPCREKDSPRGDNFVFGILEAAGEQRFIARVADFQAALTRIGASQALYRGIMEALGYTKNKVPMMELAGRMPLPRLLAAASGETPDDECLAQYQALLMGMAGLLPSQQVGRHRVDGTADAWAERLERAWVAYGEMAAMSAGDWYSFKVRPGNIPRRRLAAMSYLLLRYRAEGLLEGLIHEMAKASSVTGIDTLERLLSVSAEGYWGRNLDFGLPAGRVVPALLGKSRAEAIVVNVLLPFAVAWGQADSRPELAEKALEIYRRYPASAENTLEKHMRSQLGIKRCLVNSARRQQGLIHIYKTRCSQGKCSKCSLNQYSV